MAKSDLQVIIGLGATGLSCARYLNERNIPFAVADTRTNPPHLEALKKICPQVICSLGILDPSLLASAAQIIISPGISLHEPNIAAQIKRGTPVIGDIELFAQEVKTPVIAITGTNAKSTVTTLVGEMAKAAKYNVAVGGNLGVPVLDLLVQNKQANLFVLELSSFQLETTSSLRPQVATVLNVTPDHMDRYANLTEYQQAKQRVYQHCQVAVCNRDDPLTEYSDSSLKQKLYFTMNAPQKNEFGLRSKNNETFLAYDEEILLSVKELRVMGKHYHANALASLAIGHGFGLPMATMLKVLREFQGLPHRCQFVRERDGVSWYNDSKGTNVGATQAAIEGLGSEINGKLILIAGGVGKNADFSPLVPVIKKYARHVVLIGEAAKELAAIINGSVAFSFAASMTEAVAQAADKALTNDSVLLSPACASFDMFKNFEHRGDVFMDMVKKL